MILPFWADTMLRFSTPQTKKPCAQDTILHTGLFMYEGYVELVFAACYSREFLALKLNGNTPLGKSINV
jgi:hypothetical protein